MKGKKLVDSSWGNINIHIGLHITLLLYTYILYHIYKKNKNLNGFNYSGAALKEFKFDSNAWCGAIQANEKVVTKNHNFLRV